MVMLNSFWGLTDFFLVGATYYVWHMLLLPYIKSYAWYIEDQHITLENLCTSKKPVIWFTFSPICALYSNFTVLPWFSGCVNLFLHLISLEFILCSPIDFRNETLKKWLYHWMIFPYTFEVWTNRPLAGIYVHTITITHYWQTLSSKT